MCRLAPVGPPFALPPPPPFAAQPFSRDYPQLCCAYIIFVSAYVVAHDAPEDGDSDDDEVPEGREPAASGKGDDEEEIEGERAARAEASKLFLARYGCLIEDYKVTGW